MSKIEDKKATIRRNEYQEMESIWDGNLTLLIIFRYFKTSSEWAQFNKADEYNQ